MKNYFEMESEETRENIRFQSLYQAHNLSFSSIIHKVEGNFAFIQDFGLYMADISFSLKQLLKNKIALTSPMELNNG